MSIVFVAFTISEWSFTFQYNLSILSPVWPVQRWWQGWHTSKPPERSLPADGQDQVSITHIMTRKPRHLNGSRSANFSIPAYSFILFIAGDTACLAYTKAWRPSSYRRYWQPPSCLWCMRRSLQPPSKSWAWTRSWCTEIPPTYRTSTCTGCTEPWPRISWHAPVLAVGSYKVDAGFYSSLALTCSSDSLNGVRAVIIKILLLVKLGLDPIHYSMFPPVPYSRTRSGLFWFLWNISIAFNRLCESLGTWLSVVL